jgi:N-acetyl-alpha-D-muramate 1-phosphate uridylyltransferase
MDAMIFAAGLGTRLRPLTHHRPKALIEVAGVPVLERVARRLVAAGADRLVINTHPFPEQIREFVQSRDGFSVEVFFSHEPDQPLDTGGGLRRAAHLFRGDAPFFIHNCDVVSDFDLRALYSAHLGCEDAAATLAVLPPSAERYLIFDDDGLCGYSPRGGGDDVFVRDPGAGVRRHDFTGIHVAAPALLGMLPDEEVFSIVTHYLALARRGVRIGRFEQTAATWIDIGTHEKLELAHRAMERAARG